VSGSGQLAGRSSTTAVASQGWRAQLTGDYVDIVFDHPPGPWPQRLVDVEDDQGRSIGYGQWVRRDDGAARPKMLAAKHCVRSGRQQLLVGAHGTKPTRTSR
jgi:hypothetical protein